MRDYGALGPRDFLKLPEVSMSGPKGFRRSVRRSLSNTDKYRTLDLCAPEIQRCASPREIFHVWDMGEVGRSPVPDETIIREKIAWESAQGCTLCTARV